MGIRTACTWLLLASNFWVCDLQWTFGKLDHLWHLHVADLGILTCVAPGRLVGAVLSSVEAWLCLSKTATVLGTMLVTMAVAVAMVMAKCKCRWEAPEKQGSPPER